MSSKGKFLVLEGIDGSGKGTVLKAIESYFVLKSVPYISVKDPGHTKIGEDIRSILLDSKNTEMCRETELSLYIAARAQLNSQVIKPSLEAGMTVICDRYDLSTFTYQYVLGEWDSMDEILNASTILENLPQPDWYFVLDVPVEVARQRLGSDLDRLEKNSDNAFNKIRDRYLYYSRLWHNVSLIDASKDQERVASDTISEIEKIMKM